MIEPLEPRRLLAASAVLADGVLTVTGTDGDDVIEVYGAGVFAEVTAPEALRASVFADVNGVRVGGFAYDAVTSIRVDALAGDDVVALDLVTPVGDRLRGVPGRDDATGTQFGLSIPTTVEGAAGDDTVYGGGGDDVLLGGRGDDLIFGGKGRDLVSGGAGRDKLHGGYGSDTLEGGRGNDGLWGEGDVRVPDRGPLDFADGAPTLREQSQIDGADDVFRGGAGLDTIDYSGRTVAVNVTLDGEANDGFSQFVDFGIPGPSEYDDVGADVEVVLGGSGNDFLTGGSGDDTLVGNGGDDVLNGLLGDDLLVGGDGDDRFQATRYDGLGQTTGGLISPVPGPDGADRFVGGAGTDVVDYRGRTAGVTATIGGGADDGESGEGDDIGADVENLFGGDGDDRLVGSDADNRLSGFAGSDTLDGGAGDDDLEGDSGVASGVGDDVLIGGPGDDNLIAGRGRNLLFGGPGDDVLGARGFGTDRLDGGPGDDRALADRDDVVYDVEDLMT